MTKIKLNLHHLLVQALESETALVPATIDVSELLDFNDAYECEHDVDDLLRENRLIGHVWCIEDVRSVRPDLNDDQAWAVLTRIDETVSRNQGISRDDLERTAYDLFGTSISGRVERRDKALAAYNDDLPDSNLIDLVADAMHWCRAKGYDFPAKLAMARATSTPKPPAPRYRP